MIAFLYGQGTTRAKIILYIQDEQRIGGCNIEVLEHCNILLLNKRF